MTLTYSGITAVTAENGRQALDRLSEDSAGFDVIVLDLSMPVMDGRAFYREIAQRPEHPPVLFLSAYGALHAQRELGAAAALPKPFEPEILVARVQELSRGGS
jgi:DNA-binding response OmpR family regulator